MLMLRGHLLPPEKMPKSRAGSATRNAIIRTAPSELVEPALPPVSAEGPVSHWIVHLQAGDRKAAAPIWERYFGKKDTHCRFRRNSPLFMRF
jgi:hypothetical protein